jgi:DnaD/phage-associated family protein
VWRCTYGFQKKEHDMSLSYISEATGLDKRNIRRELKSLEDKKIIHQNIKNGSYRKLSFNKNYDEWVGETTMGEITMGETNNATMGEIDNTTMGETNNQKRNYKENIKKKDTEEDNLLKRILELLEKSEILGEKGITEFLRDDIEDIITKFGFEDPEQMIVEAVKDSARGNGKTWKYVYKKLVAWKKDGIKSLADLENLQEKELTKTPKYRKGYSKAPIRQEQTPDWFEENPYESPAPTNQLNESGKQSIMDKLNQFRK